MVTKGRVTRLPVAGIVWPGAFIVAVCVPSNSACRIVVAPSSKTLTTRTWLSGKASCRSAREGLASHPWLFPLVQIGAVRGSDATPMIMVPEGDRLPLSGPVTSAVGQMDPGLDLDQRPER